MLEVSIQKLKVTSSQGRNARGFHTEEVISSERRHARGFHTES